MSSDRDFFKRVIIACFTRRGMGSSLKLEKIQEEVRFVMKADKVHEHFLPALEDLVQDGHLEYISSGDKYRLRRQWI